VLDRDPLALGETDAARLLGGKAVITIIGGRIRYDARPAPATR
jgi:hypothetical protein